MSEQQMNNEISALEARLGRLRPAGGIDAAELMFQAGRAAGAKSRRRWQGAAVAAMLLAIGAASLSLVRPQTRVVEVDRVVYVTAPAAPEASGSDHPVRAANGLSEYSYLRLRNKVLAGGIGALPESRTGPPDPQSSGQLLNGLLRG